MSDRREALLELARSWSQVIGPRATARKLGLPEDRVRKWSSRYNWPVPDCFKPVRDYYRKHLRHQAVTVAHEAMDAVIRENGSDTRLFLSAAALKASHEAASSSGAELLGKDKSIAVLNAARTGDVVHGWTAERTQGVNVGVQVNIPLPTAEEIAERKAIHDKLSLIFKPDSGTPM